MRRRVARRAVQLFIALLALACGACAQQDSPAAADSRQSLQDAWWTGPLLANSAGTLPRGHFLIEPYVYDVVSSHNHGIGSRAYVLYGLVDRLTVGVIPIVGDNKPRSLPGSSGFLLGDFTAVAQYRLTQFREHHWLPSTALHFEQTFPTGRYDRLQQPSDGLGGGAYSTTVALNSQTYFWLPNRRILRMRFDVSETLSRSARVRDVSVYGTTAGFRGRAHPAPSLVMDAAWEYSLTRRWVLALDANYQHSGDTSVIGQQNSANVRFDTGSGWALGFAPAIEYNLSPNVGVIVGTRIIAIGNNFSRSAAPVMAINIVR